MAKETKKMTVDIDNHVIEENSLMRIQNAFLKKQLAEIELENMVNDARKKMAELQGNVEKTIESYIKANFDISLTEFFSEYTINSESGLITRIPKKEEQKQ